MQSILQHRRIGQSVAEQLAQAAGGARQKESQIPRHRTPSVRSLPITPHPTRIASYPSNAASTPLSDLSTPPDIEKLQQLSPRPLSNDGEIAFPANELESERLERQASLSNAVPANTTHGQPLAGVLIRQRADEHGFSEVLDFMVTFADDDPQKPRNWPLPRRLSALLLIALVSFVITMSSSIDAAVLPQAAAALGVGDVAESLATGLFLVGVGCGTLLTSPLSEFCGRNPVYIASLGVFFLFTLGSALAETLGAQLVCRFFAGFFGGTPLATAAGSVADLFDPLETTWAFPTYAILTFLGPVAGPVAGAYLDGEERWRWAEWIVLIAAGVCWAALFLFLPETYPHTLLSWRAGWMRKVSGDGRFRAEVEVLGSTKVKRLGVALKRPFALVREPIVAFMALYLSVLYVVLFTFLDGYPHIFGETYGIGQSLSNVIFAGMGAGILLSAWMVPVGYHLTTRSMKATKAPVLDPESRLWYAMLGGAPGLSISLYWLAWTAVPSVSIWSPILATVLFGYGLMSVFLMAYMYLIDAYEIYAASALTFVVMARYLVAGGMTVVGVPFYRNVGTQWTLTILAIITTLMVPIPYGLWFWGSRLRKRSRYAVNKDVEGRKSSNSTQSS